MRNKTAYCYSTGEIVWAYSKPEGTWPILPELKDHPDYEKAIYAEATTSFSSVDLLVPHLDGGASSKSLFEQFCHRVKGRIIPEPFMKGLTLITSNLNVCGTPLPENLEKEGWRFEERRTDMIKLTAKDYYTNSKGETMAVDLKIESLPFEVDMKFTDDKEERKA